MIPHSIAYPLLCHLHINNDNFVSAFTFSQFHSLFLRVFVFPSVVTMDHASMLAVLSFQLEEVNLFLALPELPTSDCIRQAVIVQKQELVRQIVSLRDHALCLSIGEAVQTDAAAIPLTQAAEIEHGLRDASLEAINISESEVPRASSDTPPEETVREPCDQTHDTVDELDNVPKECVACNEHKFADEVHSLPCNHDYCFDCIEHLFIDALADDSLFPPRCCGHEYPLADIRPALPPILVQEIELKLIEKATGDRTYCCNAQCSVFIPPQPTSTTTAVCTRCATSTCISCRREAHPNQPCYEVSDDAVLQLATEQGWKRCFHCRNMIELRTGCNHIT